MDCVFEKETKDSLLEKGNYILSLCKDEKDEQFEILPGVPKHYLPSQYKENETVKQYINELTEYARRICNEWEKNDCVLEILPPWIVFPELSATSAQWRLGTLPEMYYHIYRCMIRNMYKSELYEYKAKYPAPDYMIFKSGYNLKRFA